MPITKLPVLMSPETQERYCRFRQLDFGPLIVRERGKIARYNAKLDRLDARQRRSDNPGAFVAPIQSELERLNGANERLARYLRLVEQSKTWLPPKRELEIIGAMPTVYQVNVSKEAILEVSIHGTVEMQGDLYSTGDWRLRVNLRDYLGLHLKELVTPARDEFMSGGRMLVGVSDGAYRSSGTFCFGDRYSDVHDHILNGSLVAGLALAIDSINFINEGDVERAVQHFKRRDSND